jgi:hypothetical protein
MEKPLLLFRGPVKSVSGYGAHSRDLLKAFYELNLFDIKIDSCIWGVTPLTALEKGNLFHNWIENNTITSLHKKPEFYVQVTVPNEFMALGKFNIGITAGIETTMPPKDWVDGCNRMDLIITTSNFSKQILSNCIYNEKEKGTDRLIKIHKIEKPIHVLFEGADTNIFNNQFTHFDLPIDSDFCFLFVGHWLRGILGQDRKDIGMLIKSFVAGFSGEKNPPALILKTSAASFSIKERESLKARIKQLTSEYKNPPSVYLLYGNLTDYEMNQLYNHPKVKTMITFTKGEGFGRPLLEFSLTGKPIIASNWSGHKDFLPVDKTMLLGGEIKEVHESAIDKFIIKDSKWFTVNYNEAIEGMKIMKNNYNSFLEKSKKLMIENRNNFSYEKMKEELHSILKPHLDVAIEHKIKLPILNKID